MPDKTPQEAWAGLKKADEERDLDDFRDVSVSLLMLPFQLANSYQAFQVYTKAEPAMTFVDIEKKLRAEKANVYLIALVSYHNVVVNNAKTLTT